MRLEKIRLLIYKFPFLRKLLYPVIMIRRFFLQKKLSYKEEIYEQLCEHLVEDPVIKVPEFEGIFVVGCRSDLFKMLLMNKQYEPSLVKLVLKYLDGERDVIDVGANIGFYTILFAKRLKRGKVLAIEPTLNALERLYKNVQRNNVIDKVIVFEGAASDYIGRDQIKTLEGKEEYSTLGHWKHPSIKNENPTTCEIQVSTIDNLISRYSLAPGFIKIDVEGLEHLVLRGSKATIESNRPVILSELLDPPSKRKRFFISRSD